MAGRGANCNTRILSEEQVKKTAKCVFLLGSQSLGSWSFTIKDQQKVFAGQWVFCQSF